VVVLENIFRHMEHGESPAVAAEKGGREVALPVLAATLTTAVVFFPVIFLSGASRYLFIALGLAVVLSILASYFVAMTVVPLFCARLIKHVPQHGPGQAARGFNAWSNRRFNSLLDVYEKLLRRSLRAPVLVVAALSLHFVVQGLLQVPVEGAVALFLAGAALHLFATTSMGIFMATLARNMPQFGMLLIITLLPLQMLSGGMTPRESMPQFVQDIMLASPTTHFVQLAQAILYRGAGFDVVWKPFLILLILGAIFFVLALGRFRKTIGQMA